MVDAIQRPARAVGAKTIAECLESQEILDQVRGIGIDFVQGYAIHRPEPYSELATRMDYPRAVSCKTSAA